MNMRDKLEKLFTEKGVKFEAICHHRASTARQAAVAEHVPVHYQAKGVVVSADGKNVLAVVPADTWVDVEKLKVVIGAKRVELEFENEFQDLFPGCEPGAMPPFGSLFGMPLFADASLADNEGICFNAGTHKDSMSMQWTDYAKLAQPVLGDFADARPRYQGPR